MTRPSRPSRNLPMLVPQANVDPSVEIWATVTQASPLRIQLDGETSPLPFTPTSLASHLKVGDRVWVGFPTNTSPASKSRRVVVVGRAGGNQLPRLGVDLRRTTDVTITSGAASVAVSWESNNESANGMWVSGDTVTIVEDGTYGGTFQTQWSGSIGTGRAFLTILTGSGVTYRQPIYGLNETFASMSFSEIPWAAGETFTARVFQTSGGPLDVIDARLHCYRSGV